VEFSIIEKGGNNHLTILDAICDCIFKRFRWNELALDDPIIRIGQKSSNNVNDLCKKST
jgi:hypothetical protein